MRSLKLSLILAVFALGISPVAAGTARIKKTLQHRLDQEGRNSLSPSLYERDAYQAHLREHPEEVSALRFDVQWTGQKLDKSNLKIRLELRSQKTAPGKPRVLEQPLRPKGLFSHWTAVDVDAATLKELGSITAWRATIWEGDRMLAEQKSFLW